jgi:hypothetical protein
MHHTHTETPFLQYKLKDHQGLLEQLPDIDGERRVRALVQGCLLRKEQKLYKGNASFL